MKTIFYTAATVDGFLATDDHDLGWLLSRDVDPEGPMRCEDFIAGVGALARGAHTYEWVRRHEPDSWSYAQPTWVFTRRELAPPPGADVRFVHGDVVPVHAQMTAAASGRDLWVVGGGGLAVEFGRAGLLDEVWVQWAPVAIGSGKRLLPAHVELSLEEVGRSRDFACARYSVVR